MKTHQLIMIFISLVLCMSCQDVDMAIGEEGSDCGTSSKAFKKVKNLEGIFQYNEFEKRYTIIVQEPNTIDTKDMYLFYNFPENFDPTSIEDGVPVVAEGGYKESDRMAPVGGLTYYYLKVKKIRVDRYGMLWT